MSHPNLFITFIAGVIVGAIVVTFVVGLVEVFGKER